MALMMEISASLVKSFPQKRESSLLGIFWIPVFTGMTGLKSLIAVYAEKEFLGVPITR
jgi:hypothetical protein